MDREWEISGSLTFSILSGGPVFAFGKKLGLVETFLALIISIGCYLFPIKNSTEWSTCPS